MVKFSKQFVFGIIERIKMQILTFCHFCHQKKQFDVIFMDQYMPSTQRQLLGTETVRELRTGGNKSRICGLSANDIENAFLQSGADSFMLKPLPCDKDELKRQLLRVLGVGPVS